MSQDVLGDRMKALEAIETDRLLDPYRPIYARIDGRSFSRFTRDLARPYDARLSTVMIETTCALVRETQALFGYVQSDEVSLIWLIEDPESTREMFFGGKVQKLVSVLASSTTAIFIDRLLASTDPAFRALVSRRPHFDARVLQLPTREDAANMLLWRELDACRNAISMAAQSVCSHRELQGVGVPGMLDLIAQRGIEFDAYPASFRRGTFVRPQSVEWTLSDEERMAIPEAQRPPADAMVRRSIVAPVEQPLLRTLSMEERVSTLFGPC
jgi:tRNA(His) 5'-end guanylyltransferase